MTCFEKLRHSAWPYPYPYGFIIGASAEDGACVDCYLITRKGVTAGSILDCAPAALQQAHRGEILDNFHLDHTGLIVYDKAAIHLGWGKTLFQKSLHPMKEVAMSPKKETVFTDEERSAMKERAKEQKTAARRADKADEESAVLAKIAEMEEPDRSMAERIHAIIKASAPSLSPKLWYGMPAYAKDGKVVCFFQNAQKFKTRYATLGFNDSANLDEGSLWPVAYAIKNLTAAEEARISALVKKAVS